MTDEFEAKPGTAVQMPLLSEALINFAFNQAPEFVESGNSVREATSICANLLLDAAWKVAGAGAAADGFEPNKDKFRARVEDVLERVSFNKLDDEKVSSDQPSANPETPPPSPHVVPTTSAWQWWAGSDEEWCTVGPEDTREAIIQAATNDSLGEFEHEGGGWNLGFYIVEARQDPLRLADWIEADRLLERAEEGISDSDRVSSEYDDGPWFECTPEQEKDLEERVKRACDEWQAEHRLVFSCSTFSHTRNREHVIVELPDDRATTEGSPDA